MLAAVIGEVEIMVGESPFIFVEAVIMNYQERKRSSIGKINIK